MNTIKGAFSVICKALLTAMTFEDWRDFLSTPMKGWGEGTLHDFIHFRDEEGKWQKQLEDIFNPSKSCCDALVELKHKIQDIFSRAVESLDLDAELTFEHYRKWDETEDWFDQQIKKACDAECPPRVPPMLPAWKFETRFQWRWLRDIDPMYYMYLQSLALYGALGVAGVSLTVYGGLVASSYFGGSQMMSGLVSIKSLSFGF